MKVYDTADIKVVTPVHISHEAHQFRRRLRKGL